MSSGFRTVLVRHGETEWSAAGRHTGLTDMPLTPAGRWQAAAAAEPLAHFGFAMVLCSPLVRAVATAELAGLGDLAQHDDDLVEWDYGAYEGLTSSEITTARPGWSLWTDGCPDGEQAADVGQRVDRVIARCRAAHGDVALVAHGHVLRVLAAKWIELAPAVGASLALATASISILGWDHDVPAISGWNNTSHLTAEPQEPSASAVR